MKLNHLRNSILVFLLFLGCSPRDLKPGRCYSDGYYRFEVIKRQPSESWFKSFYLVNHKGKLKLYVYRTDKNVREISCDKKDL